MKHISNIHDPQYSDAETKKWLRGKILGPPKATEVNTVEELKQMGMRGVYSPEEEERDKGEEES